MATGANAIRRSVALAEGAGPTLGVRADRSRLSRRTLIVVVLVSVAGAWLIQSPGANQSAHYVSIQSLASGHHNVDLLARDAIDLAWTDGHYHAAKSPGLDLLLAPAAVALRGAGVKFNNAPPDTWLQTQTPAVAATARDIWLLTLLGALLPAIVLMLLVALEAERLRPGTGPIAAATIGAGSLMLPFSTVLFSHALSATLGFAGFMLLARTGRDASPRYRQMAVAGLLLGFAVVTEYPLALLALISFVFVATQTNRLRKLAALSTGSVVGVLPLPIYAWWAYGNPLHSTYAGAVLDPGKSGHDLLGANGAGFFGITTPDFHTLLELLFSGRGLFVVTPIAAVGIVGLVELARRGQRAYAFAGLATFTAFLAYDCAYWTPFGGAAPGPRFLVPVLPFLAVGAAVAWGSMRRVVAPLLIGSVVTLIVQTSTGPLLVVTTTSVWWYRFRHGQFVSTLGDVTGTWQGRTSIAVFIGGIVAALLVGIGRPAFSVKGAATATTTFVAWFCVSELGPPLFYMDLGTHRRTGALVATAIAVLAAVAIHFAWRGHCLHALATLTPISVAFLPTLRGAIGTNAIFVILSATVAAAPWLRPHLRRARIAQGSVGDLWKRSSHA